MTKRKALVALSEAPIVALKRENLYSWLMILVYCGLATVKRTHENASTFTLSADAGYNRHHKQKQYREDEKLSHDY